MSVELVDSNVVIVANVFNPSVVSQIWLIRNNLLAEEDFRPGCVFSDVAVHVRSRKFELLLVPPQCQFTPRVAPEDEQALVTEKVGGLVNLLPHTPYAAIGLNFNWHFTPEPEEGDFAAISRDLFCVPGSALYSEFSADDVRFGAYLSRDACGARLKLDIKPIRIRREAITEERFKFAFNFHTEIPSSGDEAVRRIESALANWDASREMASRIIHAVAEGVLA